MEILNVRIFNRKPDFIDSLIERRYVRIIDSLLEVLIKNCIELEGGVKVYKLQEIRCNPSCHFNKAHHTTAAALSGVRTRILQIKIFYSGLQTFTIFH